MLANSGAETGMDLSATMQWHGEAIEISATGLAPEGREGATSTPLKIQVYVGAPDSDPRRALDGGAEFADRWRPAYAKPDANRLAAWLQSELPLPIPGAVEAAGALRIQPAPSRLQRSHVVVPKRPLRRGPDHSLRRRKAER